MYRRVVRLQLPDHNFIIARRVRELLNSYEYLMNSYGLRNCANICLEFCRIGAIIVTTKAWKEGL